jgi:anaerobic magnesium-protoporphyrin IX monomethyl ester cyclase
LFPIGLAYVASAIQKAGHDLQVVDLDAHRRSDGELRALLKEMDFDVAAFGCIVTGYRIVKDLSKSVRDARKDVVIVAGNSVADSVPELLLSRTEVDIAVLGEGDVTIVELLDALENLKPLENVRGICFKKNGNVYCTPRREAIKDIDSIPSPNWKLFDIESYVRRGIGAVPEPYPMPKDQIRPFSVNTARGCLFRCSFCYHVFQRDRYRFRSPESILREIGTLQEKYGINYFVFSDELTFFSTRQAEEFVDRLLESGFEFYWNADIRANLFTERDMKLLKKIKESGCVGFGYSLESADPHILESMNKHIDVEDFVRQAKALEKAGLATWTSLVLGYPEETPETLKKTFDICYGLNIYPSSGYLLPQPGTPMYALAKEKGLIRDDEEYLLRIGDRQDLTLNFTKMSDEEFQGEAEKHLKRIADKLGLELAEGKLLKTGHYRSKESRADRRP